MVFINQNNQVECQPEMCARQERAAKYKALGYDQYFVEKFRLGYGRLVEHTKEQAETCGRNWRAIEAEKEKAAKAYVERLASEREKILTFLGERGITKRIPPLLFTYNYWNFAAKTFNSQNAKQNKTCRNFAEKYNLKFEEVMRGRGCYVAYMGTLFF